MMTTKTVSIEFRGLKLVALGVDYTPAEPATLRDPAVGDDAVWDVLHIKGDVGCTDISPLLSCVTADAIVDVICAQLRGD